MYEVGVGIKLIPDCYSGESLLKASTKARTVTEVRAWVQARRAAYPDRACEWMVVTYDPVVGDEFYGEGTAEPFADDPTAPF